MLKKLSWNPWLSSLSLLLIGAFIGPYFTSLFTAGPKLRYTVYPANVTSMNGEWRAIYAIHLNNNGSKMAEAVSIFLSAPSAVVTNTFVSDLPGVDIKSSISGNSFQILVPNLNASEHVDISFEAISKTPLPSRPNLSIRGRDVVASEAPESKHLDFFDWILAVIPLLCVSAIFIYGEKWLKKRLRKVEVLGNEISENIKNLHTQHIMEARLLMAYACRAVGLKEMADEYLFRTDKIAYWAEADRLVDWVLSFESGPLRELAFTQMMDIFGIIKGMASPPKETLTIFSLCILKVGLRSEYPVDPHERIRKAFDIDDITTIERVETDSVFLTLREQVRSLRETKHRSPQLKSEGSL
jgi:hypothetical protein